jgi:cyclophilin family peptidyl-prolyl cis-trans isomerase
LNKLVNYKWVWVVALAIILSTAACSSEPKTTEWDAPPELTIDNSKIYLATMETEKGDIKIELFADRAPITVNNFIFLAQEGYYDDTTFHRVLANFMAQGGDLTGTGTGGPGYRFEDEIDFDQLFDEAGYLAMANGGPDTNGSQFFITFGPLLQLNGGHTIFGKVVEGMDVVLSLTLRDPNADPPPQFEGDKLKRVSIDEISESLLPPPGPTPVPMPPVSMEDRPLALLPIEQRENLYNVKPDMVIDPSRSYRAMVTTTRGEFTIQLNASIAPESVNNFTVLAQLGYYDGFPINFVNPDELVLFGSPGANPVSDVGYGVPLEFGMETKRGSVGFWFRQEWLRLSGSQVYIMLHVPEGFNEYFTVFGEVVEGIEIVEQLTMEDSIEFIAIVSE